MDETLAREVDRVFAVHGPCLGPKGSVEWQYQEFEMAITAVGAQLPSWRECVNALRRLRRVAKGSR